MDRTNAERQRRYIERLKRAARTGQGAVTNGGDNRKLITATISMPRATQNAIAKCLHPDTRRNATEADKDEASKLFNAWKSMANKARSRAR